MDRERERETDEEIIGLLTGISVVSRRLARKLLRLHAVPPPRRYSRKSATYRKDGHHDCCL